MECPPVCVCLEFSPDWTKALHLGQEYQRRDAVAFLVCCITRSMLSVCLIGDATLIAWRKWFLQGCSALKLLSLPPLLLYLADILEKILWGYIPLSAHTFFHWFTFISKTCVRQVLFCLLTSDFPSTYINMNSVVREDCPFTPVSLFNQIFLYPHKLMDVSFSLWITVQFYHFLFCCSNCSVLATQSSCGLASRSLASQGSSTFFSLIAAAA